MFLLAQGKASSVFCAAEHLEVLGIFGALKWQRLRVILFSILISPKIFGRAAENSIH
jgi:hypothetical protein